MVGRGQPREIKCPVLGVGVGPCWVGVGAPPAGEGEEEGQTEVEVEGTPLEAVKCPGVALGLGLGEVGGWTSRGHSVQASGRPQSCTVGGCRSPVSWYLPLLCLRSPLGPRGWAQPARGSPGHSGEGRSAGAGLWAGPSAWLFRIRSQCRIYCLHNRCHQSPWSPPPGPLG